MKRMPSDKRRCGNLKIKKTYDENWKRRFRVPGKKKNKNFIVGLRAKIEISSTEWGKYETSP